MPHPWRRGIVFIIRLGVVRLIASLFLVFLACLHFPDHALAEAPLALTDEERAFLAEHPQIRVRFSGDLPPFLFHDSSGKAQGMAVDYVRLAFKRLNLSELQVSMAEVSEAFRRLPSGDGIDIQPIARFTPERAKSIHFTRPYLSAPVVIITRDHSGYVGGLSDLRGKVVGVERGYWYGQLMARQYPEIQLQEYASNAQVVRAVAVGEIDGAVSMLTAAAWQMEQMGYSNLRVAAPADQLVADLGMAVRGDWPLLAQALDKAIASITPEEHHAIRRAWLPMQPQVGLSLRNVLVWGGTASGIAMLFILILTIANRRLIREVALRKKAENQVRVSEETAKQLLNASSDACMLFDVDGTMRGFNDVFARRLNLSPDQIMGRSLWDFFPPANVAERKQAVAQVVESGEGMVTVDFRNGRHLSNSIYPLRHADGRVVRVAVYSRDITDQVNAERRIRDYVEEVTRSNQDLEQFAYVVSHDLREPLRQISSFMSLLERRLGAGLDEESREFLDFARDGARRLDRLMLDLLEYSRVGRGEPLVPTAMGPVIAEALDRLTARLEESGGQVILAPHPPVVLGAHGPLVHLIQNLVGNALKYRSPDRLPCISITWQAGDDEIRFDLSDNGIGIDQEFAERIFGIFQRLHGRDEYEGTGIGLAICRKVIDRHGGRIWLEPSDGPGAHFAFTLKAG